MTWYEVVGSTGGGLVALGIVNLADSHAPGVALPLVFGLALLGSLLGKAAVR